MSLKPDASTSSALRIDFQTNFCDIYSSPWPGIEQGRAVLEKVSHQILSFFIFCNTLCNVAIGFFSSCNRNTYHDLWAETPTSASHVLVVQAMPRCYRLHHLEVSHNILRQHIWEGGISLHSYRAFVNMKAHLRCRADDKSVIKAAIKYSNRIV